jgi:hypothetical protein
VTAEWEAVAEAIGAVRDDLGPRAQRYEGAARVFLAARDAADAWQIEHEAGVVALTVAGLAAAGGTAWKDGDVIRFTDNNDRDAFAVRASRSHVDDPAWVDPAPWAVVGTEFRFPDDFTTRNGTHLVPAEFAGQARAVVDELSGRLTERDGELARARTELAAARSEVAAATADAKHYRVGRDTARRLVAERVAELTAARQEVADLTEAVRVRDDSLTAWRETGATAVAERDAAVELLTRVQHLIKDLRADRDGADG